MIKIYGEKHQTWMTSCNPADGVKLVAQAGSNTDMGESQFGDYDNGWSAAETRLGRYLVAMAAMCTTARANTSVVSLTAPPLSSARSIAGIMTNGPSSVKAFGTMTDVVEDGGQYSFLLFTFKSSLSAQKGLGIVAMGTRNRIL
jgi:hypothetical protein